MNVGEPDIFLSTQTTQSSQSGTSVVHEEDTELQESITHVFGGLSGLLFALSLSFFLQAPLVSAGVILTLVFGWTGRAFFQAKNS